MNDSMTTSNLVQTWVPVTDARGSTHLEARWTTPVQATASAHDTHHPHAA